MAQQTAIAAILELLRQLADGKVELIGPGKNDPILNSILPTKGKLEAKLIDFAAREKKINDYLSKVRSRYDQVLLAKLDEAASLKSRVPRLPGFVNNIVENFGYRLNVNAVAKDLVTGVKAGKDFSNSTASAVSAIMSLRDFDDLLIRMLAANAAAAALKVPLAKVMALYRAEGNLCSPVSTDSLADDIPPAVTNEDTSLNPRPNISRLVLIAWDPEAPQDGYWKTYALRAWFVQIAGMDVVGRETKFPRGNFTSISSRNRMTLGFPDSSEEQAGARWDTAIADLTVERSDDKATKKFVKITPGNPVKLVDFILQEGIAQQMYLARFSETNEKDALAEFSFSLNPALSYLRYNITDTFKAILVRAATIAYAISDLRYSLLRSELNSDVSFAAELVRLNRLVAPMNDETASQALTSSWGILVQWLKAPPSRVNISRFDLLTEFLQTIGGDQWKKWKEGRGNMSRYAQLLDYYEQLFGVK